MNTGIIRKIDELGRIVIPKETRDILNMHEGDSLEVFQDEEKIILRKYAPGCTFCGSMKNIIMQKGIYVCEECGKDLSKSMEK